MTLDELAASLPNGLHDAELSAIALDFAKREARLSLDIWIGDDEVLEAYQQAEVTLSGLIFWMSEAPDASYPYELAEAITIDSGPLSQLPAEKRPQLPPITTTAFLNWIFVVDWNAFIYLAAEDASLRWIGERTIRQYKASLRSDGGTADSQS